MTPTEIATRWNAGEKAPAAIASPTQAKLQDEIMERSIVMLRQVAGQAGTIRAADQLHDQLRSLGMEGEIVTQLDDDACTICVAVRPKRYVDLRDSLTHLGHAWRLIDAHHGISVNIATLEVTVDGHHVFLSATVPGPMDEERRAA